jgi:hypothetical protein
MLDVDMRPKRDVHPPPSAFPATSPMTAGTPAHGSKQGNGPSGGSSSKTSANSTALKYCAKILKDLMHPKHANINAIFLTPVDPVALNVPMYFDVIKHPMDLSTIRRKLDTHQYSAPEEFEADVRLMVQNCLTFNHPGDIVYNMGLEFERVFNAKMSHGPDSSGHGAHMHDSHDDEVESAEGNTPFFICIAFVVLDLVLTENQEKKKNRGCGSRSSLWRSKCRSCRASSSGSRTSSRTTRASGGRRGPRRCTRTARGAR